MYYTAKVWVNGNPRQLNLSMEEGPKNDVYDLFLHVMRSMEADINQPLEISEITHEEYLWREDGYKVHGSGETREEEEGGDMIIRNWWVIELNPDVDHEDAKRNFIDSVDMSHTNTSPGQRFWRRPSVSKFNIHGLYLVADYSALDI